MASVGIMGDYVKSLVDLPKDGIETGDIGEVLQIYGWCVFRVRFQSGDFLIWHTDVEFSDPPLTTN